MEPGHTYNFQTLNRVYAGLLFLAALLVGFALLPIESLPIDWMDLHLTKSLILFAIAVSMGAIISAFLMGLKHEKSKLSAVIFFTNFAFLLIFFLFTWADFALRGAMDPSFTRQINWESPVTKHNAEAGEEPGHSP